MEKRTAFALSCIFWLQGCASNDGANGFPPKPMLASLDHARISLPAPEPEPSVPHEFDSDTPAGTLLEMGMLAFREGRAMVAAHAFQAAIASGQLNDAGRALAYWHIYVGEMTAGRWDAAVDAAASFTVLAQDIIDERLEVQYAVNEAGDFVKRFELYDRLDRARATLSAAWSRRSNNFGRIQTRPVPVHSPVEIDYFLQQASDCDWLPEEQVTQLGRSGRPVITVDMNCPDDGDESFYFELQ